MLPRSRRAFLLEGLLSTVAGLMAPVAHAEPERTYAAGDALAELEKKSGGRLGVAILNTEKRNPYGHRMDERFPMCSTFKVLLAAAVLARVDAKAERLDRPIKFGRGDLLEYAPVARARVAEGSLSVAELCDAAITVSDNTAANLLLSAIGGPATLTAYLRSLGDTRTRLDRNEPALNESTPGDPRDTTTPLAMVRTLETLLLGSALSAESRERLARWMVANTTGNQRLRAGTPNSWRIGDKTGTGERGTTNDVGILWPPGRKPLLIAVYITDTQASVSASSEVIASVARLATA
jgi:beta-lactamase class A